MNNKFKRMIEVILVKRNVIDGLSAESKIKNKLINHGNKLVNRAIKYLKDVIDDPTESVDLFPENHPEVIKYIHAYILDDEHTSVLTSNTKAIEYILDKIKSDHKEKYDQCDEEEVMKLSKIAIKLLDELTTNEVKYNKLFKELFNTKSNSVLRIYVTTDDDIPNLAKNTVVSDLFINNVFNKIVTESLYDAVNPEDFGDDVMVCCVVDENPYDYNDEPEEVIPKSSRKSYSYRNGEEIKNPDGSTRAYYFNSKCDYLQ